MLTITIPQVELYDEQTNRFIIRKAQTIQMEHSLVSIAKWEAKWQKPFLTKEEKTTEEMIDYLHCMTITQNVDPNVFRTIPDSVFAKIKEYMESPMTATTIRNDPNQRPNREIITSEIIYYWMISLNIPMEYQKWHIKRLLMLIQVCNIKNAPPKKMSQKELLKRNRELNAARLKKFGSRG